VAEPADAGPDGRRPIDERAGVDARKTPLARELFGDESSEVAQPPPDDTMIVLTPRMARDRTAQPRLVWIVGPAVGEIRSRGADDRLRAVERERRRAAFADVVCRVPPLAEHAGIDALLEDAHGRFEGHGAREADEIEAEFVCSAGDARLRA